MQQLLVSKENVLPELQEWNQNLDQPDSKPPNIKEEQEELWVGQEGKHLHGLEEADLTKFPSTAVCVTSEDEEKPQSSQLHQSRRNESTEVELLSSNSTDPRTVKTEANGDDCGGSQPARDGFQPHPDDMQQLVIKEEIISEQQECNLSVDQEDMKEEQERLWISQHGQEVHQLEEADVTKFPFTAVKPEKPESPQFHQSQSDESTEADPAASSSTVHRTLTAQADGEDDGGPQPASTSGPNSPLQTETSDRSSDSSETETDDSHNWEQARDLHSSFNCQKESNVSKQHKGMRTSEKSFDCSACGKRFGHKRNLITHMRIHTEQKPLGCSECGQRFRRKHNLVRHMRIHTGEKTFICSDCDKRFRQKSDLITHMRIHTGEKPFVCSECDKRFGQKSSLIFHLRIHTGEKPYGCSECGKGFRQKGQLISHMRTHTGEKPFGCSHCGRKFGEKSSFIFHMRSHT
ncbi:zinc finger protein with KRAB and SCAN domains 8-like, partial [Thalassophryne amazonica]|uniref:zinc finger protein with KRAB and SCAN domains 8-like n=1 Tax=Thalassophryne amazonica TaxID=390379 RepID=UPI001472221B